MHQEESKVVEDGEMTFPHLKKVKKHGTKKVAKSGHVPTALLMPGLVCHSHLILCKCGSIIQGVPYLGVTCYNVEPF